MTTDSTNPDKSRTANLDVHGLVRVMDRMVLEVNGSASSTGSSCTQEDYNRWVNFVDDLEKRLDQAADKPVMDTPKTFPEFWPLMPKPNISPMNNDKAWDLCLVLDVARDELTLSATTIKPSSIEEHDYRRQKTYILKMREKLARLKELIPPGQNPDYVETDPRDPMPALGSGGVPYTKN